MNSKIPKIIEHLRDYTSELDMGDLGKSIRRKQYALVANAYNTLALFTQPAQFKQLIRYEKALLAKNAINLQEYIDFIEANHMQNLPISFHNEARAMLTKNLTSK